MSCGAGDACGFAAGELAGIGIPGVCIWGEVAGNGEAVGICIPGVITCGLGEGEGFGLVALLVRRLARITVLFFLGALLALGLLAGFIFDMSCPWCCGKAFTLTTNIKASALNVRSAIFKLLGRFMVPLTWFAKANA